MTLEAKYVFTGKTVTVVGHVLRQIRAVRDTSYVTAGETGGFIEFESNLSHEGNCWVGDNAKVYGYLAFVRDDAIVTDGAIVNGRTDISGNALICGNSRVCGGFNGSKITDHATVCGSAVLTGTFNIDGETVIWGEP